jgi:hypothetical protein
MLNKQNNMDIVNKNILEICSNSIVLKIRFYIISFRKNTKYVTLVVYIMDNLFSNPC